ncbi:hypothetical protein H5410_046065 [Solanum commersonii]|uniref:Uncharacterized protein n=1 Tax=Solanum commersonii TaxID=4109 RepID=A0A9J5XDF1_SOLCO|nr:hypothetical protein H5410_046065 [Solanum commersonii]
MGEGIKKGNNCIKFLPRKGLRFKGCSSTVHTSHKIGHKRDHFKSLHHLINRTNGANSRCHHTWFTVSSSHKALTPMSNKTPHFR